MSLVGWQKTDQRDDQTDGNNEKNQKQIEEKNAASQPVEGGAADGLSEINSSSSSSDSSTSLRKVRSASALQSHGSNQSPNKRVRKSLKPKNHCRPITPTNPRKTGEKFNRIASPTYSTLEIISDNDFENLPKDCHKIQEIGDVTSQNPYVCSLYFTSYNVVDDRTEPEVTVEQLISAISNIISGKVKVEKTVCGVIAAFTSEEDTSKIMKLPLQKVFDGPVQVAKFSTGEARFRHLAVIKDIPWCISIREIHQALKRQGICVGKLIRTRACVKIEVLNSLDLHRLVEEGLNFFNYTSFPAIAESSSNQIHAEPDITQCFKCQGFWHTSTHCRQLPRCVRCGENHDVEYCPRQRNDPICCHCGGPHHAAYKYCPIRLRHVHSTHVVVTLAKEKPNYPSFRNRS